MRIAAVVALACIVAATGACSSDEDDSHDPASDKTAIEQVLNQWPKDFNAKNESATCGLFAKDTIVVFPDSADRNYEATCAQFHQIFSDPTSVFTYAAPEIREILVDGDLATVRLIWTSTVTDEAGTVLETSREDGVDVFRRQSDGNWKIYISHAFPAGS
jgi:uncharacterized protein (TIGR02246 family)